MKLIAISIMTIFLMQCTAENSFRSGSRSQKGKRDYSDAEKEEEAVPGLETDLGAGALSTKIVRNYKTQMQSAFWLMTQTGKIIRSVIDPKAETMVDPSNTKEWNYRLVGGGGSRTFMLEGGAFIGARLGGHLFWLDKDTSTDFILNDGTHPENYFQIPNITGRVCVVSYKRNGARYLGVAYQPKGFLEIEMENKSPFKPTWKITHRNDNAFDGSVGYTCYMDQANGIMHSSYYQVNSVYGYDVINRVSKGVTDSKNAYAMSGDSKGNLISDVGFFIKSATYEKKADRYWFTDGAAIYNSAPDCVVNKTRNCKTAPGTVLTTIKGFAVQAISGLPEGIIAIGRGGDAYYVKYDGKDFHSTRLLMKEGGTTSSGTSGLYMYTDFTGNALYAGGNDLTFDFTETQGYDADKEALGLYFVWQSDEGLERWSNLVLKVRCFTEADSDPSFFEVESVKKTGEVTLIENAQCQGDVKKAEIEIESLNDSDNITKVTNLQLYLNQKK